MIGRREIQRLRGVARTGSAPRFDIRGFHGAVLGNGAVPLGVLGQLVTAVGGWRRGRGGGADMFVEINGNWLNVEVLGAPRARRC